MKTTIVLLISLLFSPAAHAGSRSSTNYTVPADTADAGGQGATSASYTSDGSVGGVAGISSVATPSETLKAGYIGQLYEVTALQLAAAPPMVNEGGTRQLSAAQLLDDGTVLAVDANSITWSVMAGPFSGISAGGLATAGTVYQDTLATAQGVFGGLTGTLNVTVINVNTDDLPGYVGDGIDDAWQVQHFGLNNPLAGPTQNPDFDEHDNLFEFIAGLIPTDASSRFRISSAPVPSQPGQMNIVISPRLPDRTYTVRWSPTLGPATEWNPLTSFSVTDEGSTRTITDLDATGSRKFYKVEITKP